MAVAEASMAVVEVPTAVVVSTAVALVPMVVAAGTAEFNLVVDQHGTAETIPSPNYPDPASASLALPVAGVGVLGVPDRVQPSHRLCLRPCVRRSRSPRSIP